MKPGAVAQLAFVVAASVAAYAFVRAARHDQQRTSCTALCELRPTYAGRTRLAPDFELPDLGGNPVRLSSYFGRPIVLNFWTQHCEPCKKELPALAELGERAPALGIAVVTLSADEAVDDVRALLQALLGVDEPPFAVLLDPELEVIQGQYGTTKYPETWLIDADRIIRARVDGERDWGGSLAIDAIARLARPLRCPVEFDRGRAVGPYAALCAPP